MDRVMATVGHTHASVSARAWAVLKSTVCCTQGAAFGSRYVGIQLKGGYINGHHALGGAIAFNHGPGH